MNDEAKKVIVPERSAATAQDGTVDKETAENEFDRWTRAMRIKMDRVRNTNDRSDLEEDKALIVELIMEGTATVDEEGRLVYHSEDGKHLTFYRSKGEQIAEIDKVKKTDQVKQGYALAGAITRTSAKTIAGLYTNEIPEVTTIASLFLV
jgi:hypothetical protein